MKLREVLAQAVARLTNSDSPKLDAQLLLMKACSLSRVQLITKENDPLSEEQYQLFESLLNQRLAGHPIAHLLGERDFWDLKLKVTPDTLIPRPDTEVLVEQALEIINKQEGKAKVLDLGTGSGAIILSLKHSAPNIEAVAVDLSPAALQVARDNAQSYNLDVSWYLGSWFTALPQELTKDSCFDVIVSNPPYIEEHDEHLKQGDVRFEPLSALVSGPDGLDDIRFIAQESTKYLRSGGYLLLEHGYNQGAQVREILSNNGYEQVATIKDYGGNDRVTLGIHI